MNHYVSVKNLLVALLLPLLLAACNEETLIGNLEVERRIYYFDSQQNQQAVPAGKYTAYLKLQSSPAEAGHLRFRLTLVGGDPAGEKSAVIHIPVVVPSGLQWSDENGRPINLPAAEDTGEPPALTGSLLLPADRYNQPFQLRLAATHREYKEKVELKEDCKRSVASLNSDVGFEHHYYFDGRSLWRGPAYGPVHSMSLNFSSRSSYKKIRYSETGKEFEYRVTLQAPEIPEPNMPEIVAQGAVKLRVPHERTDIREFACRPR